MTRLGLNVLQAAFLDKIIEAGNKGVPSGRQRQEAYLVPRSNSHLEAKSVLVDRVRGQKSNIDKIVIVKGFVFDIEAVVSWDV